MSSTPPEMRAAPEQIDLGVAERARGQRRPRARGRRRSGRCCSGRAGTARSRAPGSSGARHRRRRRAAAASGVLLHASPTARSQNGETRSAHGSLRRARETALPRRAPASPYPCKCARSGRSLRLGRLPEGSRDDPLLPPDPLPPLQRRRRWSMRRSAYAAHIDGGGRMLRHARGRDEHRRARPLARRDDPARQGARDLLDRREPRGGSVQPRRARPLRALPNYRELSARDEKDARAARAEPRHRHLHPRGRGVPRHREADPRAVAARGGRRAAPLPATSSSTS